MSTQTAESSPVKHLIGGEWCATGQVEESINPSTGAVIGSYYAGGADEAERGIIAARAALTSAWCKDPSLRSRALNELAANLESRLPEIALMLSRENGKLVPETMWEVGGAAVWLRYAAATALTQIAGRAAEVADGQYYHSVPEPAGVVGVITPWNSPIILTARSLGPALAAGCSVVIKMPAQTALTNALFAEVVAATASLPTGVVNLFTESGNTGAPLLVESAGVDVLSYTGSTGVGRKIAAAAGPSLKRLNLELGGKTPLVVFDDANLDIVIPTLVKAATLMNGQFCVTGSRVIVQRGIADEVRERLAAGLEAVRLGGSEDPEAQLGPLVDNGSVQRLDAIVEEAISTAKVIVRGGPIADGPLADGAFYRPALIEVENSDSRLVQEELFGPVQTFEVFDDDQDAVTLANATEFGLGASVFTGDPMRARRVGRAIDSGLIWINSWGLLTEHFEEGGVKQSGYGKLCGPRAIEEFQELKVYAEMDYTVGA
jgi:betaine-aldehyde dehydrogenase